MIEVVKDGIVLLGDKTGNILNIYSNETFTLKSSKFISTLKEIIDTYKDDIDIDTVNAILAFYMSINAKDKESK